MLANEGNDGVDGVVAASTSSLRCACMKAMMASLLDGRGHEDAPE